MTNRFQADLVTALGGADEVWIGPIHRAERIPERERLDRGALAAALRAAGVDAHWTDDIEAIVARLDESGRPDDVALLLSNGAFGGIYGRLKAVFADEQPGDTRRPL